MKKFVIAYLIIFLIPTITFGQNLTIQNDSVSFNKHNFSVEGGVHMSLITGKRDIGLPPDNCECYAYWGFTEFPTTGFQINILYDYNFFKNFSIRSGLSFFNRPERYESDSATIIEIQKQYPFHIFYPDSNIIKYKFSPTNFEIPILIGYKKNNFSIFYGIKIYIASYIISKRNYINGNEHISTQWSLRNHITSGLFFKQRTSSVLKLYYLFRNKFLDFKMYIGVESYGIELWDFNLIQAGVNIPLSKKNR